MNEAKLFDINKRLLFETYLKVKANKGSSGIENVDMKAYEEHYIHFYYVRGLTDMRCMQVRMKVSP